MARNSTNSSGKTSNYYLVFMFILTNPVASTQVMNNSV